MRQCGADTICAAFDWPARAAEQHGLTMLKLLALLVSSAKFAKVATTAGTMLI